MLLPRIVCSFELYQAFQLFIFLDVSFIINWRQFLVNNVDLYNTGPVFHCLCSTSWSRVIWDSNFRLFQPLYLLSFWDFDLLTDVVVMLTSRLYMACTVMLCSSTVQVAFTTQLSVSACSVLTFLCGHHLYTNLCVSVHEMSNVTSFRELFCEFLSPPPALR